MMKLRELLVLDSFIKKSLDDMTTRTFEGKTKDELFLLWQNVPVQLGDE